MSVSVSSQCIGKHLIACESVRADSVDDSVTLVSVCLVQILCKNESPAFHSRELLLSSLVKQKGHSEENTHTLDCHV